LCCHGAADYRGGDFGKVMSHAVLDIIQKWLLVK